MIHFLLVATIPYTILFIFQTIFGSNIYLETDIVTLFVYAILFRAYITLWTRY
mgnify:CR=1 FL=1